MFILKITIALFLMASLLLLFLRCMEARILFYPLKEIASFPDPADLKFREVYFETADKIKLNGWLVFSKDAGYTVLFCHGNAGNISHRIEKIKFFNELGCDVFIFDYRGYGKSEGRPSEKGFYKDVEAAYGYLMSQGVSWDRIIGYGESIGGAVIVDLASREKMRGLILDSTLTSIKDMIKGVYPFVPHGVFSSRFDSEAKIKTIKTPKLIIHSVQDEIVPFRLGRRLYEVSSKPKDFLQIQGGHNSNFYESEDLLRKGIGDFIKKLKGS